MRSFCFRSCKPIKYCFGTPLGKRAAVFISRATPIHGYKSVSNKHLIGSSLFRRNSLFNCHSPRAQLFVYNQNSLSTTLTPLSFYLLRPFSTTTFNMSLCRQNYHQDCEAHINKQINMELYASYVYMSMAYYFDRDDVSFPGLHKFFKKASEEEREHAEKFMKYQNSRGGRIVLQSLAKPTQDEWGSPLEAMSAALELERTVNQTLLGLHSISSGHNDAQLCDFLETHFLEEQVQSIKELSGYVTQLQRCGKGLGEYLFDNKLGDTD